MTLVVDHPQERAWREGERDTISLMGSINVATARLVSTIAHLIATDGWHGHGIHSVEHWVRWKACISPSRAENLVRIAHRMEELPRCWALFEQGRITEDLMTVIARRLPAARDAEIASQATTMMVTQLSRVLRSCPELPEGAPKPYPAPQPERYVRSYKDQHGWVKGEFCLPPEEAPLYEVAMAAARDAEFRDRKDLPVDAALDEVPHGALRSGVSRADAFVRMLSEATDGLDKTFQRTGYRGEQHQIVLHHDVDPEGRLGPAQLHLGATLPPSIARYFACDAKVMVAVYERGRLVGFTPQTYTPSRALRRALERRDQGCAHPLCEQRRWLHVHHIQHWEDGGLTVPSNLLCLCQMHHRQLHAGDFTIDGDPEAGTVRFLDRLGHAIEPPGTGPPAALRPDEPSPYSPPYGGHLATGSFSWN
jgi:hypothetical protein